MQIHALSFWTFIWKKKRYNNDNTYNIMIIVIHREYINEHGCVELQNFSESEWAQWMKEIFFDMKRNSVSLSSHVMLDLLYEYLLYGRVLQGLGTTELMNLIGWNRYWQQSRFSHLDRRLDRLQFVVKKLQTKIQKYLLPSKNTKYKRQQRWRAKNGKKDKKTLEN